MRLRKIIFPMLILIITIIILTGCGQKKDKQAAKQTNIEKKTNDNIVREGLINVEAIDADKDGRVYQCPMDVNVISDKPGTCPVCKMDLEEVTVDKAKDNLVKSDFKVK